MVTHHDRDAPGPATRLLELWRAGDSAAREDLVALLYDELRLIARRLMRSERRGHTLEPTGVVNEACLRLLGSEGTPAGNRAEFLGLAARVMRQVLVDHARRRDSGKRGGDWTRVSLAPEAPADAGEAAAAVDALSLHSALERLAVLSPRQAHVAELRYFGGLTVPETAEALQVSPSLVKQEWRVARLWLKRELDGDGGGDGAGDPGSPS